MQHREEIGKTNATSSLRDPRTTAVRSVRSFAGVRPETLHASVPGEKRSARRDATLIQSLFWASLGPYRPRIYN